MTFKLNSTSEIDDRIKTLFNIWVRISTQKMEFDKLFNNGEEDIQRKEVLLNDFFIDLQDMYWERFLITIAKLLDPAKQGKFDNLSLFTLSAILKEHNNSGTIEVLEETEKLKEKFESVINYRRKNLAHYDVEYTTGSKLFNSSTHIEEIESFLNKMIDLINKTLESLGHAPKSTVVMYPGRFKGAAALNRILNSVEV